jgi:hypothetical protein
MRSDFRRAALLVSPAWLGVRRFHELRISARLRIALLITEEVWRLLAESVIAATERVWWVEPDTR